MTNTSADQMGRFLTKAAPADVMGWLLGVPPIDFAGWLDTANIPFPGQPERRSDCVAYIRRANGDPWALDAEWQTDPDFDMPLRLIVYLGNIGLTLRPSDLPKDRFSLGAVLIHLRGQAPGTHHSGWPEAQLDFSLQPRVRNLAMESARDTLAGIAAGSVPPIILGLIPLMAGGDDEAVADEWLRLADPLPVRIRSVVGVAALEFSTVHKRRPLWKRKLKGWHVVYSEQVLEWQEEARQDEREKAILHSYTLARKYGATAEQASKDVEALYGRDAITVLEQHKQPIK